MAVATNWRGERTAKSPDFEGVLGDLADANHEVRGSRRTFLLGLLVTTVALAALPPAVGILVILRILA